MLTINENPFELAKALSGFHYINGDLVPSVSGKNFPVKNPATMIEIGAAAESDADDVEKAVQAAKKGLPRMVNACT